MNQHRFALALCTLVSSLLLADVASAYPTTSGTTVKKTYRPLDLTLNTLVEDTDDCVGCVGGRYVTEVVPTVSDGLSLTLVFTGDWTPSLEDPNYVYDDPSVDGGFAGYWVYELDTADYLGLGVSRDGDEITVSAAAGGVAFGTLTHVGGFVPDDNLPSYDTPLPGDVFKLFTTPDLGATLLATLLNVESDFAVKLIGQLVHVGPFVCEEEDDGQCRSSSYYDDVIEELCDIDELELDTTRNFPNCTGASDAACGRVTALDATSVPEPGTLALFGLGLASLGIRFRSRRKARLL